MKLWASVRLGKGCIAKCMTLDMDIERRDKQNEMIRYPTRIFRFSSIMMKWAKLSWCSPMKECGTRWRNTSERRPPVCSQAPVTTEYDEGVNFTCLKRSG